MFLVCGVAVGGGDDPATPPVPAAEAWTSWAFVVPPTDGPPASSCADDVGAAPEAVQWPRRTARTPSARGRPAPRDKQLVLDGAPRPIALHTAMSVDTIPQVGLEGDDAVRARLAAVWDRADAGEPVRLSFFGASHTGGDYWTGHLRRRLQDRWGDRGHGFILPAPLYAGYRGQDVNLCATHGWQGAWVGRTGGPDDGLYGFMGGSVRTDQAGAFGWLETTRENPHGRAFSRLDLFALAAPEAGSVTLDVDGQVSHTVSLAAPAPRLARVRLGVEDGAHRVRVTAVGDGEVRLFGASLERDGPGVIVDAMGIRGRTARTWRAWDPSLLAAGLSALGPDVVVLAYGTNEAADTAYEMDAYRDDLHAVLRRLRETVPHDVPCILVGPSDRVTRGKDDLYRPWERTRAVAQVQREVAPLHGCLSWDWQAATGGEGSMLAFYEQSPKLGAGDLIHFRKAGYEWSAERFLRALDDAVARGRSLE